MINKKRGAISLIVGALILALGLLPSPSADLALWPGSVLASPVWPEGIHSDFGGPFNIVAMLVVVWGASFAAWSTLAYLAGSFFAKSRVV